MKTILLTLVTALVLAGAGAGEAADKCLSGASTLGDQRALRALRAAIDAACPCAEFTGEKGRNRAAYRRCARQVRDAAFATGGLRRACRAVATRGYHDTTCGAPGRVTCGRVRPAAKKRPITCRITTPDRCRDGARHQENACTAETHCSDVVEWTAGTCIDVRDRVPFETGVRTITFTKQSALDPTVQRDLETTIWYPTAPGSGPIDPATGGVIDAPLDSGAAPYPLLLFSHGSCGYPLQSTFLTALLAAQGFVVVAPPHPGNTIFEAPACGTFQAQAASFVERPQDVIFVLNRMLAANQDPSSPFFGAIDPERIGMSGHSFGGLTTHLVEEIEPRVKVAIPMAAATLGNTSLAIPSLSLLGQVDSVVNNAQIRATYQASTAPKYLVQIQHAGHYAFSNLCFPGSDCNPPVTLTQDEAHGHVLRWVLPFLELHLNGNQDFAPFFLVPEPGVVFSAVTE